MSHPYETLPQMAFWRPAVAARDWQDMRDLWQPKFDITAETRIATFGSCFAQHFSKALQGWGVNWLNAEPAPSIVPEEIASAFGYNIYSARTGNIYTAAGLRQWLDWAFGETAVPEVFWHQDGRVYDPFRPAIEADGFDDIEQARAARQVTLDALRNGLKQADILVFTLGLTEGWVHSDGHVYPMCPGTVAGQFDATCHSFVRYGFAEVTADLCHVADLLRRHNPEPRLLLTVSPVPLAASASGQHVLTATCHSKATLRAVAGELAAGSPNIDYFPSYEMITGPGTDGRFFAANRRSVTAEGVAFVMESFAAATGLKPVDRPVSVVDDVEEDDADDVICEEILLDAFADKAE